MLANVKNKQLLANFVLPFEGEIVWTRRQYFKYPLPSTSVGKYVERSLVVILNTCPYFPHFVWPMCAAPPIYQKADISCVWKSRLLEGIHH